MEYIEVTGRTIDDALTNACLKLETTSDNIEYEVIEKGSNGLFGIFNYYFVTCNTHLKPAHNKPSLLSLLKKLFSEKLDLCRIIS